MEYLDFPENNDSLGDQCSDCAICLKKIRIEEEGNGKTTEEIKINKHEINLYRLFSIDLSEVNKFPPYHTSFCQDCLARNQSILALFEQIDLLQENLVELRAAVEAEFKNSFNLDECKLTDEDGGRGNSFFRSKIAETLQLRDPPKSPVEFDSDDNEYPDPLDIISCDLPDDENVLEKKDEDESESRSRFFLKVKVLGPEEVLSFGHSEKTGNDDSCDDIQDENSSSIIKIHNSSPRIHVGESSRKIEIGDSVDQKLSVPITKSDMTSIIKKSTEINSDLTNIKIPKGVTLKDCRVQIETLDPEIVNNIPVNVSQIPNLFSRSQNSYGQRARKRSKTMRFACDFQNCSTKCSTGTLLKIHKNKCHSSSVELRYDCQHCGMKFRQRAQLKNHVRVKHLGQLTFVCPVCNKGFTSLIWNLKRHLTIHDWEKDAIDKYVDNLSEMQRKSESTKKVAETSEKCQTSPIEMKETPKSEETEDLAGAAEGIDLCRYQCQQCEMKFRNRPQLENHVRVKHLCQYSFVCPVCNKGFTSLLWNLKPHLEKLHGWGKDAIDEHVQTLTKMQRKQDLQIKVSARPGEDDLPFQCEQCERKFRRKAQLTNHVRVKHLGQLTFVCPVCKKGFTSLIWNLKRHLTIHNWEKDAIDKYVDNLSKMQRRGQSSSGEIAESSENRGEIRESSENREEDSVIISEKSESAQENLGKIEKWTRKLPEYRATVAAREKPMFYCDVPGCTRRLGFFDETELDAHVQQAHHGVERPHECKECGRKFRIRWQLNMHMKTRHLGDFPCVCPVCGKGCRETAALRTHMNTHTNARPYKCKYCPRGFNNASARVTHTRRAHTHERPSRCDRCGKGFFNNNLLNKHMKCVHNKHERPVMCHLCGKTFPIKAYLQMHMINTHKKRGEINEIVTL